MPFFRQLSGPVRDRFLEFVTIFAHEKVFTPAGGMEITDEVRVVISACAVRLIPPSTREVFQLIQERAYLFTGIAMPLMTAYRKDVQDLTFDFQSPTFHRTWLK